MGNVLVGWGDRIVSDTKSRIPLLSIMPEVDPYQTPIFYERIVLEYIFAGLVAKMFE